MSARRSDPSESTSSRTIPEARWLAKHLPASGLACDHPARLHRSDGRLLRLRNPAGKHSRLHVAAGSQMPSRLDLQRGTPSHGRNCASRGGRPLIDLRRHGSKTVPRAACYVAKIRPAWIGATTFVGSNSVPLPASLHFGLRSFRGPLQARAVVRACRVVRDRSSYDLGCRLRCLGTYNLQIGANV